MARAKLAPKLVLPVPAVPDQVGLREADRPTTVPAGQVTDIYDFYDAMRKVVVGEQPLFDQIKGTPPNSRGTTWNFTLELKRAEVR